MVLYYHTSSLNFNSIVSYGILYPTDYISKGFGYRLLFPIRGELQNCITLYDKPLNKSIIESELEQYLMVIKLEVDELNFKELAEGMYITQDPIYLDMNNIEIYFPTKEARNITVARAKLVTHTKYLPSLLNTNRVHDSIELSNNEPTADSEDLVNLRLKEISVKDKIFSQFQNALRGALYGYALVGCNSSSFTERLGSFQNTLTMIASGAFNYEGKDPMFNFILKYICSNSRFHGKRFSDEELMEYVTSLEDIASIMSIYPTYIDDFENLEIGLKDTLFNRDAFDKIKNKSIKALYIVMKRYYNPDELYLLQEKYLPKGKTLISTFYNAFNGFAALTTQEYMTLPKEVLNTLEEVERLLLCKNNIFSQN